MREWNERKINRYTPSSPPPHTVGAMLGMLLWVRITFRVRREETKVKNGEKSNNDRKRKRRNEGKEVSKSKKESDQELDDKEEEEKKEKKEERGRKNS